MPHHDNLVFCHNKLTQGFRLNTRLNAGILRCLFLFASEICNSFAIFDDSKQELVDMFNAGLKDIKDNGTYDEIIAKYLGE